MKNLSMAILYLLGAGLALLGLVLIYVPLAFLAAGVLSIRLALILDTTEETAT
jgi:uncharacterized membrane-anchored protein YitT (DUF2179 family)